jgi:TolB-like protein/Tfp pilus assembly protein PilF
MLSRNRFIHQSCIEKFNGTLIKEIGDGILASFSLASEAVRCAIEIQKECKEQEIPLKIGIHEGEMIFSGSDVIGDGVNVASRLQEISKAGCITISGTVQKDIKNKAGIATEFMGNKKLKHVDDAVLVYEVLLEEDKLKPKAREIKSKRNILYFLSGVSIILIVALIVWKFPSSEKSTPVIEESESIAIDRSIAVLPFDNMSNDPDQEYFCDGMMEEILMHLYKIGDLRVTSRTSVMGYKETKKKAKEIARELGVAHILEGSVRKSQDRIRITVQLIDSTQDQHLWAETYDRELADIFTIQSEVAQQVALALKAVISPDVKERIEAPPTENLEAYELYLKGNSSYDLTLEGIYTAMDYYNQAIALDGDLAEAYVGLGSCNWYLAHFGGVSPGPFWIASRNALETAITLDSNNAEAYGELGVILHNWDWDSAAARKAFEKALYLEPNNFRVLVHFGVFNFLMKKFHLAESVFDKLVWLEPNNRQLPYYLLLYIIQGNFHKASQTLNKIDTNELNNWVDFWIMADYYFFVGDLQIAAVYYEKSIDGADIESLPQLAYTYAKLGELDKAKTILNQLKEVAKFRYISPFHFAIVYMGLDDHKKAIHYLKKAHEEKDFRLHWIGIYIHESIFEPLQSNPEYQEIISNLWN